MIMPPVTQEHALGCGIACTAFIAKISYKDALKLFSYNDHIIYKGVYCKDIINALNKSGRCYQYGFLNKKKHQLLKSQNIIVFLKRSNLFPVGHYFAKSANGLWMNPWINDPEIKPAKSGFQETLPYQPSYIIYPDNE